MQLSDQHYSVVRRAGTI